MRLQELLARAARDLDDVGVSWALVGGMAASARAEPRTTRDIDVAVAADDDAAAEQVIFALQHRGYALRTLLENTRTRRLATARLRIPDGVPLVMLDVLFASSGIEPEIVAAATSLAIVPGLALPVAAIGHLIAMKVLARDDRDRPQDYDDLRALIAAATTQDLEAARAAVRLIEARGFDRGRPLHDALERLIRQNA